MRWDIGIDLGTRCVRLTENGESGLFSEPAALVLREDKQSLLCAGDLAFRLTGRTRSGVNVHYPLKDGVLENNLYADRLFGWLYRNTDSGSRKRRFNVLVTCAPFARPVQKEALVGAALAIGINGFLYEGELGPDSLFGSGIQPLLLHRILQVAL